MRTKIIDALEVRLASYVDLINSVDDTRLGEKIDVPKHKSLIEHLWCVVGARESYAKSLRSGTWEGFSCSMTNFTQADIADKLQTSAKDLMSAIAAVDDWTEERDQLLLTVAEHEVMHEGGIIRHMYAFENEIPASVKWA